jgi:branched-chain amino acid transport system permease protein
MTGGIALILLQQGIVVGAIYALLALAFVLVFSVSRVLFLPQGQFVVLGTMTLAQLQAATLPSTIWLLLALAVAATIWDAAVAIRRRRARGLPFVVLRNLALPIILGLLAFWLSPLKLPLPLQVALTLALVVPLGPMIYRLAFQPIAEASVLVLLIVAVAVDAALVTLSLFFFGAEGWRTATLAAGRVAFGPLNLSAQQVFVVATSLVTMVLLSLFFARTVRGKALRATAINRVGAQLSGIGVNAAGRLAFGLAAFLGCVSGILIGPISTIFYDSGFLIGLKGFIAMIIGGVVSYPLAVAAALAIGVIETFASFWASAFRDAIICVILIPILLWQSWSVRASGREEEE